MLLQIEYAVVLDECGEVTTGIRTYPRANYNTSAFAYVRASGYWRIEFVENDQRFSIAIVNSFEHRWLRNVIA